MMGKKAKFSSFVPMLDTAAVLRSEPESAELFDPNIQREKEEETERFPDTLKGTVCVFEVSVL